MLGDVVRGLISLIRGDRNDVYWETLGIRFREAQRQSLRGEALKAPKRVHRLSAVLMLCFLLIYLVVFATVISGSLGSMLGMGGVGC